MQIELVDVLRCPRGHEETWLVASADRTEDRRIVEGTLGCPICHAEYPVRGGIADFSSGAARRASPEQSSAEKALRLAALLDLTPGPGFALLFGSWGSYASELSELSPVPLMLVNPPPDVESVAGRSIVLCDDILPLATARARAGALDLSLAIPLEAAADAVRAHGRIVCPASIASLAGVREIARDADGWVGVRDAQPSAPITLSARSRQA